MPELNIDQQIINELEKLKDLTSLIKKSEENYNAITALLDEIKKRYEVEKNSRNDEFKEWQIKYSNEMKSLNKGLEGYIKLIPKDYSREIINIQEQVKEFDYNQSKIDKLERNQKMNFVFIIILIIMNFVGIALMFIK